MSGVLADWWEWVPELLPGLWLSIKITAATLIAGLPAGLLLALGAESRFWALRGLVAVIVEVGRGTPAIVVLYFVFFGLPQAGLSVAPFEATAAAFAFTTAAYTSEIFRGGLRGVGRGQFEASQAIGLSPWNEYRLVVLPQAVRLVLPPLVSFAVLVFQGSSLAFAVGLPELISRSYNIGTITFTYMSVLCLAACMYLIVAVLGAQLARVLEKRLQV